MLTLSFHTFGFLIGINRAQPMDRPLVSTALDCFLAEKATSIGRGKGINQDMLTIKNFHELY